MSLIEENLSYEMINTCHRESYAEYRVPRSPLTRQTTLCRDLTPKTKILPITNFSLINKPKPTNLMAKSSIMEI